jgi:hypothetical protein
MSTRCLIAYQKESGEVESVYCHFDGYISGVGKMLVEHYGSETKIQKLISGGDFRSLQENISDIEYYDDASTVSRNEYCFVSDADPQYHEYLYQFVSNNSKAHGSGYWRVSQAKKIEVEDGYQNFAYYYSDFVTIMNLRDA